MWKSIFSSYLHLHLQATTVKTRNNSKRAPPADVIIMKSLFLNIPKYRKGCGSGILVSVSEI